MGKRKAAHHEEVKAFLAGKTFETCKDAQWFFEKETGLQCTRVSFYRQYIKYSKSITKYKKIIAFLSNYKGGGTSIELIDQYMKQYKSDVSITYFRRILTQYNKTKTNEV